MMAIFLFVASAWICSLTQPSSNALSMIEFSMSLIVTAGSFMPKTHAPSHGAGQTLPVNSGKLFVFVSRS